MPSVKQKPKPLRAKDPRPAARPLSPAALRQRAESVLSSSPERKDLALPQELRKLVHELQVHQVELEMQNEELRRAELELAASRDRFSDLFDFAPVGYVTLTGAFLIREANLTIAELLGVHRKNLIGKRFARFIPPEWQESFYEQGRAALVDGAKRTCELQLQKNDRTRFQAEMVFGAFRDADGKPTQLRLAVNDITARVESLKALQRSEKILNDFFDQATVGLLWVDQTGRILRVNQAQLDLLGCTRPEAVNACLPRFLADPDGAEDLLRRLNRNETLRNYKARFCRRGGAVRIVLIDANALREDGRFVHSRWFVRDITDRTELEQDVLKATDFEQQRIARDLHDDLGQYLTGLVHVNNALRQQLAARQQPEVDFANRLAKLLDEASDKVRALAHGLQPVPPEQHGLMAALSGLADRVSSQFKIDCRFRCAVPVSIGGSVTGNHLYRIALEAVNNAIKHSQARTIEIELARNAQRISMTIQDDGRGLPVHLDAGRGMGVRIMKYRAGVLGGSLTVEPAMHGGTTVVCSVPLPASAPNLV